MWELVRDTLIHTLDTRGLEEPYFQLCCCVSFVLAGNRCWFYILLIYLEYHTVVVLCLCFGSGGKFFFVLRTYLVYNTVVWLCQFFCCGGKLNFVQIFLLNDNLRKFLLGFFFYRNNEIQTFCTIISQKYRELSL
jgi:hypothetical protein